MAELARIDLKPIVENVTAEIGAETSAQLDTRDTANRDRTNHTGTQLASTISDLDTAITASTQVTTNTSKLDMVEVQVATNVSDIDVITEALGNLANAQGSIESHTPQAVDTTEVQLTWEIVEQSTDTSVYEFDDVNNYITFKKPGSYNFLNTLTFESSTTSPVDVEFTIRNTADESILVTQDAYLEVPLNDKATTPVNTLVILEEAQVPMTVKVMSSASGTGMTMFSFKSILATMESVSAGFADHNQLTGTSDAESHPASAISYDNAASELTATTIQVAIDEVEGRVDTAEGKLDGIEVNAKDDQVASEVPVTPHGNLSSINVQLALQELQTDIDTINEGEW